MQKLKQRKTVRDAATEILRFIGEDVKTSVKLDQELGFSACLFTSASDHGGATQIAIHAQGDSNHAAIGISALIESLASSGQGGGVEKAIIPEHLREPLAAQGIDPRLVASLSYLLSDIIIQLDINQASKALLTSAITSLVEQNHA